MPQTEVRTCELKPKVGIGVSDLNLLPSKEEMKIREYPLRSIEDHDLGFTQVNHQLSKITKKGQGI